LLLLLVVVVVATSRTCTACRLQAVGSAMDSLSWLVTYNTLHGPKPPAGNVDLLHSMHQQVSTALGELVSTWVPPYPLLNCGPKDGLFIPTCDTCNQKIDVRRAEAVPEHVSRWGGAGDGQGNEEMPSFVCHVLV
jgi:hypothetical protein